MNKIFLSTGGGEILQYVGKSSERSSKYEAMDNSVINQFNLLPIIQLVIVALAVTATILIILKVLKVKSPFRGKAITSELTHLDKVQRRDEYIVQANKRISTLTKIIEKTPFSLDPSNIDYMTYNLERADIRIPGGYRVYRPQEYNAMVKTVQAFIILIGLFILIFNAPMGAVIILLTIIFGNSIPMMYIRSLVKSKDEEIVDNFADFYLMLHYVLLASAGTPMASMIKSYDKTTSSEEMHKFVDVCLHFIDTYGEYGSTRYIAKQYREIPEVGKLMRLIRQANEGGDVRAELIGFRNELIAAKKYSIQKRMEKAVMKAKASFNILLPILIQAVISAMAIYFSDLKLTSSFF